MKHHTTMKDKQGNEISLFPLEVANISRDEHPLGNGIIYNASDYYGRDTGADLVYAPFSCKIVKSENLWAESQTHNVIFQSTGNVRCPNGYVGKVTFLCAHKDDISNLNLNDTFNQGDIIYQEGTFGKGHVGEYANHVHIEAVQSENYKMIDDGYYYMDGSIKLNNVFYINDTEHGNSASYGYEEYVDGWNGWIADGSEWYYYKNGVKASGWLKTSDGTFYLDPNNGNAMATGWIKINGSWFYLNPKQGEAGHKDDLAGGAMVTGWVKDGSDWYWMSPTSGVMQVSTWVAAGGVWYYVLSNGKMATNCQIKDGGKYYAFASDGKCINGAGQTTQYNTTTYPMKS